MHLNGCHAPQRDASTEHDNKALNANVQIVEYKLLTITKRLSLRSVGAACYLVFCLVIVDNYSFLCPFCLFYQCIVCVELWLLITPLIF